MEAFYYCLWKVFHNEKLKKKILWEYFGKISLGYIPVPGILPRRHHPVCLSMSLQKALQTPLKRRPCLLCWIYVQEAWKKSNWPTPGGKTGKRPEDEGGIPKMMLVLACFPTIILVPAPEKHWLISTHRRWGGPSPADILVVVLPLLPTICVTLSKLLNFSVPLSSPIKWGWEFQFGEDFVFMPGIK